MQRLTSSEIVGAVRTTAMQQLVTASRPVGPNNNFVCLFLILEWDYSLYGFFEFVGINPVLK